MTNVLKGLPTRTQFQHSPEYYKDTVKRGVGSLKAWFRRVSMLLHCYVVGVVHMGGGKAIPVPSRKSDVRTHGWSIT